MFAEDGFETVSTERIATAAGVSPAVVTHHFGAEDGLRAEVDEHVLRSFTAALERAYADPALSDGDLFVSLSRVTAQLFGTDVVIRGYLRQVIVEGGPAGTALAGRLLDGVRIQLDRLAARGRLNPSADLGWAPLQILFLLLGPMLMEPVLGSDPFRPDRLTARSRANQQMLTNGLFR
jgi:AcrR family transcriptional regulator